MSDFKLEFTLRQHTPLIHFQHDQAGATLRATEVKPKLDNYISHQLGGWENIKILHPEWLVGKGKAEHSALDYKIKISGQTSKLTHINRGESITQFFANMGNDYRDRPRCFSWCDEPFKLEITTSSPLLRQTLEAAFPIFLGKTNFGGRQNKGFGSFFLENKMPSEFITNVAWLQFQDRGMDWEDAWKDALNVINYYYQRLKSGVNYCYRGQRVDYQHSALKQFFANQNPGNVWEKKWLKEKFLSGVSPDSNIKNFVRPFLGLPYEFRFMSRERTGQCNPNKRNEAYPEAALTIEIRESTGEIKRVKSPIIFKPIISPDFTRIFIFLEQTDYSLLLNRTFAFSTANGQTETLQTPAVAPNLDQLLAAYHTQLGNSFTAYTFTGSPTYEVTLHP